MTAIASSVSSSRSQRLVVAVQAPGVAPRRASAAADVGDPVDSSNSGATALPARWHNRACSSSPPNPARSTAYPGWKRCCSGTNSAGGAFIAAMTTVTSRLAAAATSRPSLQRLDALLQRVEEQREVDHRPDRVQPELELGDHAEVAAAAAQRPEQVRVLVLGRPQDRPSAVTTSAETRLSIASPCRWPSQPMPPPRVSPPTPVWLTCPRWWPARVPGWPRPCRRAARRPPPAPGEPPGRPSPTASG